MIETAMTILIYAAVIAVAAIVAVPVSKFVWRRFIRKRIREERRQQAEADMREQAKLYQEIMLKQALECRGCEK